MKRKKAAAILTGLILLAASMPAGGAGIMKSAVKAVSEAGAGGSHQRWFLVEKPAGKDTDILDSSWYVGKKDGTRLFLNDINTEIRSESPSRRFTAKFSYRNYGFVLGAKFRALPGGVFTIGHARKVIHNDPFIEYINGVPNPMRYEEVRSQPFHLGYRQRAGRAWSAGVSYDGETVHAIPINPRKVATRIYTIDVERETARTEVDAIYSKLSTGGASQNSNIELRYAYKPHRAAKIYFGAGMFTRGIPTGGGAFSAIGGQLIIPYLNGQEGLDRIFTGKFAYFTLGADVDLDFD